MVCAVRRLLSHMKRTIAIPCETPPRARRHNSKPLCNSVSLPVGRSVASIAWRYSHQQRRSPQIRSRGRVKGWERINSLYRAPPVPVPVRVHVRALWFESSVGLDWAFGPTNSVPLHFGRKPGGNRRDCRLDSTTLNDTSAPARM